MAKLTTHATGRVEKSVSFSVAELTAMLRERYPIIPTNAGLYSDLDCRVDDNAEYAISLKWIEDPSLPANETVELPPAAPACGRRCPASPPEAEAPSLNRHVMIPKDLMADSPEDHF
jgi:hypothetical protein